VYGDDPVVSDSEWQSAQPTFSNISCPFCVDCVGGAGVGGAESRANAAKLTVSDDISAIVPIVVL
jgi:hypothetical protein